LIYGTLGSDYLLVTSKGGFPTHPLWYTNLEADAVVTLQVGADVFQARASTMPEGAERDAAWQSMVDIWSDFAVYQTKTERRIPLVRLARI
jgi:deazaflavin-dependent oxidoreductase (nitroreductase family)